MQITIAITRLIISKGAFVCLIYVAISSIVERSLSSLRALSLKNGAKKMRKRGRHEADRGRHEAVEEKTKFLGPQFCRSGIRILRKGEFDFVKPLTHEKHCIQISKHVINHEKIMHMEKKEDKWRKPRSVKDCG
ncbi:hypothetical protein T03_18019 [Trichinella britovi]|uniref:Uncharacterized protein n=1 Tax=Trichinella britovi TaxID=45882 RepID=A0A0V1CFZ5_TRIBR|nr:hypothetical protein T03_18019 [Trichinella britovi]